MLVGLDVADEDQGVVVLDLLHGRLGGQGVLDDVVSIHAVPAGSRLARVLGGPGRPEGLWPVELDTSPDLREEYSHNISNINCHACGYLLDPGAMHSLHHLLLDLSGLLDCCHGGLRLRILKIWFAMESASGRSSSTRRPHLFLSRALFSEDLPLISSTN